MQQQTLPFGEIIVFFDGWYRDITLRLPIKKAKIVVGGARDTVHDL